MNIETKIQEATEKFTQEIKSAFMDRLLEAFGDIGSLLLSPSKANGHVPTALPKMNGKTRRPVDLPETPPRAKKGKSGRLARRSPEQIVKSVVLVADLLKKSPGGLRAEQIRGTLGFEAKEMPRILKQGLAGKSLRILSGAKRSTTYGLGGAKKPPKK